MREGRVDPEGCLRSLTAEALLWAHPHRPLFPVSLGVMAVANAFVMLGLLPEPVAEAILAEHRSALERQGFGDSWGVTEGELTVRPGAHGYWQSRTAGPAGLREVPVLVAAAGVRCPNPAAEVCFEWVKLTSTGLRVSFRVTAADPGGISPPADAAMRQAMSEISVGVAWPSLGRCRSRRSQAGGRPNPPAGRRVAAARPAQDRGLLAHGPAPPALCGRAP